MKKVVIIFLAAVFMLAMYVPVSAADWNIYGSARVQTFFTDYDEDLINPTTLNLDPALDPRADTTQFEHNLNQVSRFGLQAQNGLIGGHFEAGFAPGIYTRHIYGTVDMPFGQLLVGQSWTPYGAGSFISSQVYKNDEGGLPFIGYGHRKPMIQLSVENFKIALVEPQRLGFVGVEAGDSEVFLPMVQASYDVALDGIHLHFAGAFQTYDLENEEEDWDGETLNALGVTANARFTMMDPMYFNIGAFYGMNHAVIDATYNPILPMIDDDEIADTDTFGILLAAGTTVNNIGLELGFGYRQDENDTWDDPLETMLVYANANIPLSPDGNAFIVPEIGYYDYDVDIDNVDLGDKMYAGLKWQINF